MTWSGSRLAFIAICSFFLSCQNRVEPSYNNLTVGIIPQPQEILQKEGMLLLNTGWSIEAPNELKAAQLQLTHFFQEQLNLPLSELPSSEGSIVLQLLPNKDFGQEGYVLSIEAQTIQLSAQSEKGIARGISSLKQLILLNHQDQYYYLPEVSITDWAAFQHRGLLLDCSRHFFSVEVVKKYIDLLALFKMNTLHWHLTEDQAWRIAIEKYPKLTEVGAYRIEADGSVYGGFYSQADVKEIVAYASQKQINVIPEIELPGHAQAAIAAYPNLSCKGDSVAVANDWGVFKEIYCAGNEEVFTFLEDVLSEVIELFPSPYIHIGGDEAPKIRWEECAKCQKRIKDENLKDEHELQSYFIQRIERFLSAKGKKLIGWDEILEGGLAEGAIVQSWRGMNGGIEAVKKGHQAIMSPTSHAYFDYDLKSIDLQKVYAFYPIPKGLSETEQRLILGGECNMWTEHVPNEKSLDQKVFPRLLAMSEVLWSDSTSRDFKEFTQRVQKLYAILDRYEVHYGQEAIPMRHEIVLKNKQTYLHLLSYSDDIQLHYQFKCQECDTSATRYTEPIHILTSSVVEVQPYKHSKKYGEKVPIPFAIHKAINANVTYLSRYSDYYSAGGNQGLVDGKLGTIDFRDGSWQGFWGNDLEVILNLEDLSSQASSVTANFYQYNNSWIFIPKELSVESSIDGKSWKPWGRAKSEVNPKQRGKFLHTLTVTSEQNAKVNYLKIRVKNIGKVPNWHEAAGSDAWIFIDEIQVK